jgi:hypothetical protein
MAGRLPKVVFYTVNSTEPSKHVSSIPSGRLIVDLMLYVPGNRKSTRNKQNHLFKGIVQPFELGGETRLIRSAEKY